MHISLKVGGPEAEANERKRESHFVPGAWDSELSAWSACGVTDIDRHTMVSWDGEILRGCLAVEWPRNLSHDATTTPALSARRDLQVVLPQKWLES